MATSPTIISDPEHLREAAGTAYVVLRPLGALAERFDEIQGQVIARLGEVRASVPVAHATMKAYGRPAAPLVDRDDNAMVRVVGEWAAATRPPRMIADACDAFDEECIPIVRLRSEPDLRPALADLRRRSLRAGLPGGHEDRYEPGEWIFHLSLAYPYDMPDDAWVALARWVRSVDVGGASCGTTEAELLRYGGPERTLGRFPFSGDHVRRSCSILAVAIWLMPHSRSSVSKHQRA